MNGNFDTHSELSTIHWLGFWGSYLGGALGSVAALIALAVTFQQQEKQHQDSLDVTRINQMPVPSFDYCLSPLLDLDIKKDTSYVTLKLDNSFSSDVILRKEDFAEIFNKLFDTHMSFLVEINNLGVGPLIELKISTGTSEDFTLCSLGVNCSEWIYFAIPRGRESRCLNFQFSDIFGNIYTCKQDIEFDEKTNAYNFHMCTPPELVQKAKTFQ